jgi:hypothetical protein
MKHLVGSFAHVDTLTEAVRTAQAKGFEVKDVYSPVPVPAVIEQVSRGRSPVRFITFTGGIVGLAGGLALALLTAMVWDLIVFGKPVTNIVPFLVIGFEGTILFGGLCTLLALLVFAGLPFFRFPTSAYRPEFSKDRFGLWIACPAGKAAAAEKLLSDAGADKVETLERK